MDLHELTQYLDGYLRIAHIPDSRDALNGLQVENARAGVSRVAAAVDACEATIRMASEADADLLLVHHGLYWGGLRPLTGMLYRRIRQLVRHDVALYAAHLPLDCHPEVGNNPVLARRLGLELRGAFGASDGVEIGVWGVLDEPREDFARRVGQVLAAGPPRLLPFGPLRTRRVGVVTGAGGSLIAQAAAAGLDTLLTGEGQHWTYFDAEELGINVVYAGHYATETVGVQALAEHLTTRFGVPSVFLDHPTGL